MRIFKCIGCQAEASAVFCDPKKCYTVIRVVLPSTELKHSFFTTLSSSYGVQEHRGKISYFCTKKNKLSSDQTHPKLSRIFQ